MGNSRADSLLFATSFTVYREHWLFPYWKLHLHCLKLCFPFFRCFCFSMSCSQAPPLVPRRWRSIPGRQIIYIFYSLFLEFHEKFTETLAKAEIIQYQKGGKNVHAIHDAFILSLFYPYREMPIDCERVIGVCHTKWNEKNCGAIYKPYFAECDWR